MTSSDRPTARIVVGVDGSASSLAALRWAARIGGAINAEIEAVTSWRYPTSYGLAAGPPPDWRPDTDASRILSEALDAAFGADKPAGLSEHVYEGDPAKLLIEASSEAEMLVVGSRGHGEVAGLLLGSVSTHCVEHARCPVVVIRGTPPGNQP